MLGKIEDRRRRGQQRLDGMTDSMDMSLCELAYCDSWGCKELDMTERLD